VSTFFISKSKNGIDRDKIRYDFAHEIPSTNPSILFKGREIKKGRRVSIMFRDELQEDVSSSPSLNS
jgi:hypothetical protein